MMGPLENMRLHEKQFTKSDKIILDYMENNLDVIASNSILGVAEMAKVSKSALLRFCKKCGYEGYSELKYDISRYLLSGKGYENKGEKTVPGLLELYADKINSLKDIISETQLDQLTAYIINANKIKAFGYHETGLSASYLEYRMMALGLDCQAVTMPNTISEKASFSSTKDINIFYSISGLTQSIVDAVQASLDKKAKTVVITSNVYIPNKDKIDVLLIFPPVENLNEIFIDSQAILFVITEVIINHLAKKLKDNENT